MLSLAFFAIYRLVIGGNCKVSLVDPGDDRTH
jgi:hypothetical protein